ncbi:YbaB/EbfC family nucleoid-associated protein [Nocardioides sp. ChNu-153]|uniref:YbaB/EbfC family nucleoid-associated protein n=1 Tax=unclassified Nocardioides TaxID=2615069 RepID=UPI002406236C|nr:MULTISPECIES: YbaB/EbfC family nucleoid-associated protein [unclassified Nocardioides]MDF9717928.1 YbaB/EbfC family nucleoid-associated protein [Nocardioides sp. ChNu-99]MDN7123251.1 YbaB/EbfC family nucleoid-associated protein [Nocardioides sp. ChNu-153]
MSQNPFDPAGGGNPMGGLDMGALLQQAQAMQEQLVAAQAELEQAEVTGTAMGVNAVVTGAGELRGVTIPAGTFDGGDAESLEDLGDAIVAAYRDARAQADQLAAEKLGPLAGGLGGLGAPGQEPGSTPGLPGGIGF